MNKTIKYILVGVALFFGIMIVVMLFMGGFGSKNMQIDMENGHKEGDKSQTEEIKPISKYQDISTKELASMLENKDFTLVNVHVPYIGDIERTDASIPFNEISDNLDELLTDKNAKIVLYCQSGGMSAVAANLLTQSGYTNVFNLEGGMIQWQKDGYLIIKNKK